VTTGRDENADALFNDRPLGERRNSRRGAAIVQTDTRVSWTITGRTVRAQQGGFLGQRGPGGGGPRGGPNRPGGQQNPQKRLEMFVSVMNVFNRVNYGSFVGVLTSPWFGQPTSAQAARRMEMGWRFSF
jgi:hypothetical protein